MRSGFQQCLDHAMIRSTGRSRRKAKPQPTASDIPTYDYVYRLKKTMWDRLRSRRLR